MRDRFQLARSIGDVFTGIFAVKARLLRKTATITQRMTIHNPYQPPEVFCSNYHVR